MIIELIKVLIICYVLVDLTSFLGELISEYSNIKNKVLKLVILVLSYIMTCEKCSSFWLSLILTGDLFISAVIAIVIKLVKKFEYKINKTEL
jgi:hypothetical protein